MNGIAGFNIGRFEEKMHDKEKSMQQRKTQGTSGFSGLISWFFFNGASEHTRAPAAKILAKQLKTTLQNQLHIVSAKDVSSGKLRQLWKAFEKETFWTDEEEEIILGLFKKKIEEIKGWRGSIQNESASKSPILDSNDLDGVDDLIVGAPHLDDKQRKIVRSYLKTHFTKEQLQRMHIVFEDRPYLDNNQVNGGGMIFGSSGPFRATSVSKIGRAHV